MITGTFYTLGEVANRLQKHRNTVARWIKQGKLPAIHLGNVVLVRKEDVERVIRGVPGLVSYTLLRTADGGVSVTVCQDKAGTDESVRVASEWIKENITGAADPPAISEGDTILHLSP